MTPAGAGRLSRAALAGWTAGGLGLVLVFLALGTWQVERRAWKLDLIDRVTQRVAAAPAPAPGPAEWPSVSEATHAYRHIRLTGTFQHDREALVQATTVLGAGHWVLTPLRRDDGTMVLVNRGFVQPNRRDAAARDPAPTGSVTVTGLLRITEPGGGFLRRNDPAADRWHSRDVAAIAASRHLERAAPYFVDEDASPGARGTHWPAAGLTVVSFPNSHLVYLLTWYTLAGMVALAVAYLWRTERRARSAAPSVPHAPGD